MPEETKRQCPNCKKEILVAFPDGKLGPSIVKDCPSCKASVLFCPDGYIVQSLVLKSRVEKEK